MFCWFESTYSIVSHLSNWGALAVSWQQWDTVVWMHANMDSTSIKTCSVGRGAWQPLLDTKWSTPNPQESKDMAWKGGNGGSYLFNKISRAGVKMC